jgi:hypothetical protein
MDWNKAKRLPEKHFRRATGLTPLLFLTLVETIKDHLALRKYSGHFIGRRSALANPYVLS